MHQRWIRHGLSAFFFERLAHRLRGDRLHQPRFDEPLRKQLQRPALAAFRRGSARPGHQVRFGRSVQRPRFALGLRAVAQRRFQSALGKAPPHPTDGGPTAAHLLSELGILLPAARLRRVSQEQNTRVLALARRALVRPRCPFHEQPFFGRQAHHELLGPHDRLQFLTRSTI
jgi:hypothetical protein